MLFLARDVWNSHEATATLALTDLLPPTEAVHFSQVETAKGCYDAIVVRYSTPSSASLSRLLMPFVFHDIGSFAIVSDLATHLHSLDTSYRAACTEAQLLLAPPSMWLTVHWLVTRLPDRLSSACDVLLQKHPSELTIHLLESTLSKIESSLLSVASATNTLAPRFFEGCATPQLPTFTATRATAAVSVSGETAAISATGWQKRGKGGKKGGKGGGGGGRGGGGAGSGSGGIGGGTGALGGGDPGGGPGQAGPADGVVAQDQWIPEWLRQQILQEDFRRRHTGGGAANKTVEGYGAAGGSRGRGGGRGRGRGRGFGRGRGRGSGAQGSGAHGKADPGMFLIVEDVKGSESDVGSVGKVVMHPLTHWVIDSGCTSHMTPWADLLDEVKPPGKIKFVAAASGALLPVIGVGNAKVMGANGGLVGLGIVLLVEGLSANLLSVRRLQKSKAKVTFGPTSYRANLGKLQVWDLEEKSSCIKDLWQLPIIP
ncbi:unnamed protein product [Closterium sp. NIES-54]